MGMYAVMMRLYTNSDRKDEDLCHEVQSAIV